MTRINCLMACLVMTIFVLLFFILGYYFMSNKKTQLENKIQKQKTQLQQLTVQYDQWQKKFKNNPMMSREDEIVFFKNKLSASHLNLLSARSKEKVIAPWKKQVQLQLQGSYEQLLTFMDSVAKNSQQIVLQELIIKKQNKDLIISLSYLLLDEA